MQLRRWVLVIAFMVIALPAAGCARAGRHSTASTTTSASTTTTSAATTTAAAAGICRAKGVVERFLHGSATAHASVANSGYPQCVFGVGRVRVTVEVDTEPQAYAILERTVEEASQIFPVRLSAAPSHIGGLGIDADWFPEEQHLMTTDAIRLVTTTIDWPGAPVARKQALAVAASRLYLGRSRFKAATPIGP